MSGYEEVFASVVTFVSSLFIIFGGVLPYLPQYLQIRKERSSEGFSTKVCLVLLVANILRINFWFGKVFETPLLVQSIIMIFTMVIMLEICVRMKKEHPLSGNKKRGFSDFDSNYFWKWTDFSDYMQFLAVFTAVTAATTSLFVKNMYYVEAVGTVSLITESTLAIPQLLKNRENSSTEGMSVKMVLLWFIGDSFKTLYFILRAAPNQFVACGSIQTAVDIMILYQVLTYEKKSDRSTT